MKMFRKETKSLDPESDKSSLGNLAVELGYCSDEELRRALRIQNERIPLGEILVEIGAISRDYLDDLLVDQKIQRGQVTRLEAMKHERSKKLKRLHELGQVFKEATSATDAFVEAHLSEATGK